jgi:hypothetical protein
VAFSLESSGFGCKAHHTPVLDYLGIRHTILPVACNSGRWNNCVVLVNIRRSIGIPIAHKRTPTRMRTNTVYRRIANRIIKTHPLLHHLFQWITVFNLPWRKLFLDICQTGFRRCDHIDIQTAYSNLVNGIGRPILNGIEMTNQDMWTFEEIITSSRIYSSVVSMHLRSEACTIDDQSDIVLKDGILKEIRASMTPRIPIIDYRSLFSQTIPMGPYRPITPSWVNGARSFMRSIANITHKFRGSVLFPIVQRRKNMSQETCSNLYQAGYRSTDGGIFDCRTADLEIHYHNTGEKVHGDNEMRWAWRYNDLKPRCYYCIGGTCYWHARYVKVIAIEFMESVPITKRLRRRFPEDASRFIEDGDWVVIWDYASFTSSLSELRWFLYWACRYMEEDPHCRGCPLKLFDYREGIIEANIWDLLDDYNNVVNCFSGYSLHRIMDDIGLDNIEDFCSVRHVNSGALGVQGNIGFSTACGGLHTIAATTSAESGVGMGDDILGITDGDPRENGFVEHIQMIGDVPRNKFGIFGPVTIEELVGWKFVKRPLRRTIEGFTIDEMLNFPILAYVFAIKSRNRKFFQDIGYDATVHRFALQVSAFLWSLQTCNFSIRDDEIDFIHSYLASAYFELRIPFKGVLPGLLLRKDDEICSVKLAIPSINFLLYDPRVEDWAEYLWMTKPQLYCKMAVTSPMSSPLIYDGPTCICSTSRFTSIMMDLGYVKEESKLMELVKVDETNYRRFRATMHGDEYPLSEFSWLKSPPHWFDSVLKYLYPERSGYGMDSYQRYAQVYSIAQLDI